MVITVDVEASVIELAGRRLPACGLVCPPDVSERSRSRVDRSLGQVTSHPRYKHNVYVPLESGVLVDVEWWADRGTYDVGVYARTCGNGIVGECVYLPITLMIAGTELVPWQVRGGPWDWRGCEGWWVVEHIDRLASLGYREPPGPRCEVLSLRTLVELQRESV